MPAQGDYERPYVSAREDGEAWKAGTFPAGLIALTGIGASQYIHFTRRIPMLKEKVLRAIQDVRPSLQADGGDIELVSVSDDGIVKVRLTGACGSCPMSVMTLKQGVESYLRKVVPEVKEVVQA